MVSVPVPVPVPGLAILVDDVKQFESQRVRVMSQGWIDITTRL